MVGLRNKKSRDETASLMMKHGLKGMRISELEIVRAIRERKEFTIPEIMELCGSTKTCCWRAIQKLMEKNLVVDTALGQNSIFLPIDYKPFQVA